MTLENVSVERQIIGTEVNFEECDILTTHSRESDVLTTHSLTSHFIGETSDCKSQVRQCFVQLIYRHMRTKNQLYKNQTLHDLRLFMSSDKSFKSTILFRRGPGQTVDVDRERLGSDRPEADRSHAQGL